MSARTHETRAARGGEARENSSADLERAGRRGGDAELGDHEPRRADMWRRVRVCLRVVYAASDLPTRARTEPQGAAFRRFGKS